MMTLPRLLSVLLVLLMASVGFADPATPVGKPLTVYFLDVGQGDAALIISPAGKTVLIDGGPPEAGKKLAQRLKELVQGPLDLVILTHPHRDHLGGLDEALKAVGARRFMDPGFNHPGETYRDLLKLVGDLQIPLMSPAPNPQAPENLVTVGLGEGTTLTLLWPRAPQDPFLTGTRSDANSNSIVAKLTYGQTAFFFTGDAEPDTEAYLLQKKINFTSTVLKVAHHGGRHSSTKPFLAALKAKAAVISCGTGNDYGHPTPQALKRLADAGLQTFRTDQHGEVKAVSTGTTVTLTPQRGGETVTVDGEVSGPVALGPIVPGVSHASGSASPHGVAAAVRPAPSGYVSLKGSKVFHRTDCPTLERSKSKRTTYATREAAAARLRPAEDCDP